MGCVNRYPANTYNFIRWHACNSVAVSELGTVIDFCALSDNDQYELPNNIIQYHRCYRPAIVDGKSFSFYANLEDTINTSGFDDWELGVFDLFGNEVYTFPSSPAPLVKDEFTAGYYRFYGQGLTITGIATGNYFLAIYSGSPGTVRYVSNEFRFVAASDILTLCYLEYRNASTMFKFNYSGLPTFYNQIFADFNNIENQPDIEKENYPEVTTGEVRSSKVYSKKIVTLEADYFDDYAHDAMLAFSGHDNITINKVPYEVNDPYEIIPSRANSLKRGTITLFNSRVSTINLMGYDE